jgi:competence/damage-inducible protein CinA-like protein
MTGSQRLQAVIVSVGNELLYGETVDTNAAWLGRALAARGIPVARRFTVGDDEPEIRAALARATAQPGLVLVSGGLGPTSDDRTRSAAAAHFGRPLVVDEDVRRSIEERYAEEGIEEVSALAARQAEVLDGSRVLRNVVGAAPGLLLEADACVVVLLPGVPAELRGIVEGDLSSALAEKGLVDAQVFHRVIHTSGTPESALAEALEARLAALPADVVANIDLAYLPDLLGVDVRFTLRATSQRRAEARFDRLQDAVEDVVGPWSFEATTGDLAEAVIRLLRESGRTLAVAESCTGGLLGKRVTDHAGASDVFLGGVIAYSDAVKTSQVGVAPQSLDMDGAVSETVAGQLASRVATRFGADTGVGITGVAGPDGGSIAKPVGTVWIGTYVDGRVETIMRRFPGARGEVRARAAQAALTHLYRRLLER